MVFLVKGDLFPSVWQVLAKREAAMAKEKLLCIFYFYSSLFYQLFTISAVILLSKTRFPLQPANGVKNGNRIPGGKSTKQSRHW